MPHIWKSASVAACRLLSYCLGHVTTGDVEGLARHILQIGSSRDLQVIEVFAKAIHETLAAAPNHLTLNGETFLIEKTAGFNFGIIFDTGANVGDWSAYAYRFHRNARIHCFEIVPATYKELAQNLSHLRDRVVLNMFGLSDCDGKIKMYVYDNNLISSLYNFGNSQNINRIECAVRRGDSYALDHHLSSIDFLKIDVEGAESMVIKGMGQLVDERKIRLIQFEYNRGAIESRFLLIDFYKFFSDRKYVLGKLTPDGVLFRPYDYAYEDFNGPNYVACLAEDNNLIQAISVK